MKQPGVILFFTRKGLKAKDVGGNESDDLP
jgi:hypothetical protein